MYSRATYRNRLFSKLINCQDATGGTEEEIVLRGWHEQAIGQPLGHSARRAALIGLDLLHRRERAAHLLRERLLGQIQGFASAPHPVAK